MKTRKLLRKCCVMDTSLSNTVELIEKIFLATNVKTNKQKRNRK